MADEPIRPRTLFGVPPAAIQKRIVVEEVEGAYGGMIWNHGMLQLLCLETAGLSSDSEVPVLAEKVAVVKCASAESHRQPPVAESIPEAPNRGMLRLPIWRH